MEYHEGPRGSANRLRQFPGPVVLAALPAAGWRALWDAESENGLPHQARVRYRSEAGALVLSLRTVRPEPVPPPVIRTVESMATVLLQARRAVARPNGSRHPALTADESRALLEATSRDEATAAERPCVVRIDEVEISGRRKDFPDCSVVEFHWHDGIRVFGVGDAAVIDRLSLRSAPGIPLDGPG